MKKEEILHKLTLIKSVLSPENGQEITNSSIQLAKEMLDQVTQGISMAKFTAGKDLTGQKFGHLTVVGVHGKVKWSNYNGYVYSWECRCACGEIVYKNTRELLHHKGKLPLMCPTCSRKITSTIHGKSRDRVYALWIRIRQNCYDKNCPRYYMYGGKGITVCDEWVNDFPAFEDWAYTHGYRDDLNMERINKNDDFKPGNCIFVYQNKIEINGEVNTIKHWCRVFGVNYATVVFRKSTGVPQELWFYKGRITKEVKKKYGFK